MAKTISKKSSVKDSVAKTLGKPPPGIKPLGLIQKSASMLYKMVMTLKKEKKQKYLSFTTQASRRLSKTS